MEILGYIVCDKKISRLNGFVGQVSDIKNADPTKPILIVGWDEAKRHEGYTSILEKRLGGDVYWTFSKSESRSDFENDLDSFINNILYNKLNKINYYYINFFKLKYSKIKKIYNILFSDEKKNIYISKGFVYFPYNGDAFGFSLDILEFCGISRDKVLSRISANKANKVHDDSSKEVASLSRMLCNKKYAVPYFI